MILPLWLHFSVVLSKTIIQTYQAGTILNPNLYYIDKPAITKSFFFKKSLAITQLEIGYILVLSLRIWQNFCNRIFLEHHQKSWDQSWDIFAPLKDHNISLWDFAMECKNKTKKVISKVVIQRCLENIRFWVKFTLPLYTILEMKFYWLNLRCPCG